MTPAPGTVCGPDEYETDDSVLERREKKTAAKKSATTKTKIASKKTAAKAKTKAKTPSKTKTAKSKTVTKQESGEQEAPMNGDDLRARLAQGTPVVMPGVWDALSARLVVQAGFRHRIRVGLLRVGHPSGRPRLRVCDADRDGRDRCAHRDCRHPN